AALIFWPPTPFQILHAYDFIALDYHEPRHPVRRPPVSLPGRLTGLARRGGLVFATGPHATDTNNATSHLHALAYDGFVASLIDSLPQTRMTTGTALISDS